MSALLASLDVALRADTGNLESGLQKSQVSVAKFSDSVKASGGKTESALASTLGKVGGSLQGGLSKIGSLGLGVVENSGKGANALLGLGSSLTSLGSSAITSGTLIGGAMLGIVGGALAAALAIGKMSMDGRSGIAALGKQASLLGITTTALAGLQHGAEVSGVDVETLNESLAKFQQHIAQAAAGGGEAGAAFAKLGLRAAELKEMSLEQSVGAVADAIKGLGAADQIDLVKQIFGRGAVPLVGLLKKGSEGIREFTEEAKKLGLSVSGEQAEAVRAGGRAWRQFTEALSGMGRSFAVILAPIISSITSALQTFAATGATALASNITFFQELITTLFQVGSAGLQFTLWMSGLPQLFTMLTDALGLNMGSWNDWKNFLLVGMFTVQFYLTNWQTVAMQVFDRISLAVTQFGNRIAFTFTDTIPKAFAVLGNLMTDVADGDFAGGVAKAMKGLNDAVERPISGLEKELGERIERRGKGLEGDLNKFIDQKMAQFNKAPKPDDQPGKGSGFNGIVSTKPAAMEFGSKEAFAVLYGTESAQEKALHVANEQLAEMKEQRKILIDIAKQRLGIGKARL